MRPNPQKYEFIYFSRRRSTARETRANITLPGIIINPNDEVRVLGVWLDLKLRWGAHIRRTAIKVSRQLRGLRTAAASTWEATFSKIRQIYSAVVRPSLAYGATIWHQPSRENRMQLAGAEAPLDKFQNQGLRTVAGAFRATPVRALETETFTPPLNLYLDS
jgi:hypothetical protein